MHIQCFKDLPLGNEILRAVEDLGFSSLFPIQAQAIVPLLEGKDVIGQAHTGTGKTAAFGIPMVERLNPKIRSVQGLVLVPTRELAVQVAEHLGHISKYKGLKVIPVYGGVSIQRQIDELDRGVQIVVGTPGRIIDHLERHTLNLASARMVVLDEADRMLDMGFIEDIEYILSKIPMNRQTSLFSATIGQSVMSICNRYMRRPVKILVSKDEITLSQISQFAIVVNPYDKFRALCNILDNNHMERVILFCRTRRDADWLADRLRSEGYDAKPLHGGFTQSQRESVVRSFREGRLRFLVATDVAARGLDIQGISHVVNYDVPLDALVYFHRIGRTARMEHEGTAVTLVGYEDISKMNEIKTLTKTEIEELEYGLSSQNSPICLKRSKMVPEVSHGFHA